MQAAAGVVGVGKVLGGPALGDAVPGSVEVAVFGEMLLLSS